MENARTLSAEARQLEINVLGFALEVRAYLQSGDPKPRQEAGIEAANVEKHLTEYERLAATAPQREMAERFAISWRELAKFGQVMLDADSRQMKLEDSKRFYDLRTGLENLLDQEMQAEAVETYNARRESALREAQAIVNFALILLGVGVVIAVVTSVPVSRGIVRAEQELQRAYDAMEEKVQERTVELGTANEALRVSNRELEQFASVASHDLQEPLRKIQAFGDRLQAKCAEELGEQGHEYLERILVSAARMRRLIDDLLSFSRVSTKAQPFLPTSLAALAQEAVSDLEGRLRETGGRVEVGDLPTLDADPSQMRQVFQNLIANGLKFHRPEAPPVVRVRGRLLPDGSSGENGNGQAESFCEIAVEDNGIGFEETYLDRIFEVFQRLHGRNEYEGTGMGLAICRKIIERHGGRITAKSSPGNGATFLMTLPIRQQNEE